VTSEDLITAEPKSIEDHIQCLARLTGAPHTFIDQVRSLFTSKGIPLASEAQPFIRALDEAFRREEHIRASSHTAQYQLSRIRENFRRVGRAYVDQLSQLRRLHSSVQEHSRRLRKKLPSIRQSHQTTRVMIKGDHRSFVTAPVREQYPMVPGPKEEQ
jgi:hypothetical protein